MEAREAVVLGRLRFAKRKGYAAREVASQLCRPPVF